mmetsp:Transcript_88068/g.251326  ORF Transcript_88068/g.251326 Transcript_88068/m.251326 type:complete len:287 (-) Transcript_88068:3956-4816(-)
MAPLAKHPLMVTRCLQEHLRILGRHPRLLRCFFRFIHIHAPVRFPPDHSGALRTARVVALERGKHALPVLARLCADHLLNRVHPLVPLLLRPRVHNELVLARVQLEPPRDNGTIHDIQVDIHVIGCTFRRNEATLPLHCRLHVSVVVSQRATLQDEIAALPIPFALHGKLLEVTLPFNGHVDHPAIKVECHDSLHRLVYRRGVQCRRVHPCKEVSPTATISSDVREGLRRLFGLTKRELLVDATDGLLLWIDVNVAVGRHERELADELERERVDVVAHAVCVLEPE